MIKNALHRTSVLSCETSLLTYAIYWHLLVPGREERKQERNKRGKNCREGEIPKPLDILDKE